MAQQAVSKAVAQLERELGVELLERTTREVRLTPAGAALLAAGPDALAGVERAFAAAVEVGRGLAGTVRLGATPALGLTVLDAATQALRDAAPDLAVAFLEVRPRDIERALRDRTVDLVLARTVAVGPDVDSAALRPTPAVIALPAEHRAGGPRVGAAGRARRRAAARLEPAGHALHRPHARAGARRRRGRRAGRVARDGHARARRPRGARRDRARAGGLAAAAGRRLRGARGRRDAPAAGAVGGGRAAGRRRAAARGDVGPRG